MHAELIREDAGTKTSFKWNNKIAALAGRVLASVNAKEKICRFMSIAVRNAVRRMNFLS
jgi:hypothetical protein